MSRTFFLKRLWDNWRDGRRLRHLQKYQFEKVWKGKDLERFYEFLLQSAIPAGGFLMTYQVDEGGLVWLHFLIDQEQSSDTEVQIASLEIAIPGKADERECPEEWKGLPVCRFPTS